MTTDQYQDKYNYWMRIRRANRDFTKESGIHSLPPFIQWMKDQWGIEINYEMGSYTAFYTVLDEQKYILFLLKYK